MAIEERFGGRGRAVITASSAMEYAFEGEELADADEVRPSVFTSALVEGLDTGEADRDQDGHVGLDELYDYVYDRVRESTPNQTPGKWTFGVQGELYIARRSRPVSRPAPLPAELRQAVDHPLPSVRLAAVQELERLLRGAHGGLAIAARLALERLIEDDSRTVTTAAAMALGLREQAAAPAKPVPPKLELSASSIDFGEVSPGDRRPERRVRLDNAGGGTLNAHATSSASWIELDRVGDELVVAVDVRKAGEHEGTVTVSSDGGTATIRVLARVHPGPPPDGGRQVPARPVEGSETRPAAQEPRDHLFRLAGDLAIAAAALLVVSLFPTYADSFSVIDYPEATLHVAIVAALASGAGACLLVLPARSVVFAGVLLGCAVSDGWGLLGDITNAITNFYGQPGTGLGLAVVAEVILMIAASLAGLALARTSSVRVALRPPQGVLPWLVALLGLAGAAVFLVTQVQLQISSPAISSWVTAMALLVPALAVLARPRRFGVGLLAGWIGGGLGIAVFYAINLPRNGIDRGGAVLFGCTLLALLLVTVPFAYAPRGSPVDQAAGR